MSRMKNLLGDTLFEFADKGRQAQAAVDAKVAGMQQVDDNAKEDWKRFMYAEVVKTARRLPSFTSDDVFDNLPPEAPPTHDLRAFGPVMMRAARDGVCQKANVAPVNSRRASLHASPRAVWDSLIFGK